MTKAGKNSQPTPNSATIGRVVRGQGELIEMIEFDEYRSNPTAPTILVDRVVGIYHNSGLIRCTFGLELVGAGGVRYVEERASLLWQPPRVMAANEAFQWAFNEFAKGTFSHSLASTDGSRKPRTQ